MPLKEQENFDPQTVIVNTAERVLQRKNITLRNLHNLGKALYLIYHDPQKVTGFDAELSHQVLDRGRIISLDYIEEDPTCHVFGISIGRLNSRNVDEAIANVLDSEFWQIYKMISPSGRSRFEVRWSPRGLNAISDLIPDFEPFDPMIRVVLEREDRWKMASVLLTAHNYTSLQQRQEILF